jgi:3-phosphoshikimate 1-carboxyvinyltransferase
MSGILAGQDFTSVLTGDESLQKRPMRRVMEPLAQMGAKIESNENRLPLTIHGKSNLEPITYALPVASAQVKSCVLLAGLNASGKTKVLSPKSVARETKMRNHTELMLQWFGVDIEEDFVEIDDGFVHQTTISGDARLTANGVLNVPSDVSSAAFFLVAAACLPDSEIMLENVGLNPTRTAIIEVLRNFGARIETQNEREVCNELVGEIIVRGGLETSSKANILRGEIIAGLIDELPILSIFGTQIEGGLEIRDAQELRVKESDRIAAVVENLRRMNARVEEFPDGLRVEKSDLRGAKIDSFGDHRIAMAFSIAAIFATGETEIEGADCVKVSFPEFFNTLKTICE